MERELVSWLIRYGTPLLFFAQVFGIVGVPIPDELLLTVAGALVRKRLLRGSSTAFAAVGGCLTGITVSYAIGRVVDVAVLHSHVHRHQPAIDRAQSWFRRFGSWLIAFGYFIPGVRHVTAILAGSSCLGSGVRAVRISGRRTVVCRVPPARLLRGRSVARGRAPRTIERHACGSCPLVCRSRISPDAFSGGALANSLLTDHSTRLRLAYGEPNGSLMASPSHGEWP